MRRLNNSAAPPPSGAGRRVKFPISTLPYKAGLAPCAPLPKPYPIKPHSQSSSPGVWMTLFSMWSRTLPAWWVGEIQGHSLRAFERWLKNMIHLNHVARMLCSLLTRIPDRLLILCIFIGCSPFTNIENDPSPGLRAYEVQGPLIVRRVQILSKIRSGLSNHLVRIPDLGLLLVKSGGKKHGR